jgi:subtilisin family serine protease
MRPQARILLLIGALSLVAAAPAASAQKLTGRGDSPAAGSVRPPVVAPPPRGDGPHRGGRHPGWHGGWGGPGIVVALPPGGRIVDDGPPPRRRDAQRRASGAPAAGETRLVPDEVLITVANSASPAQIEALQRRLRLTPIERQTFLLTGTTLYRWRIPDQRSVAAVVRAAEREGIVAAAQPNYLFALQDDAKAADGAAQYALAKLKLPQAHALATGDDVRVAVIDSAIDVNSAELAGSIVDAFDALATPSMPHKHGTAIAGLIAAHGRLVGAAPGARILAVRAFDPDAAGGAAGTTFNILEGLDWAAAHGARVVNMSFAGPNDPALRRALAAAHKKGIVLVAAAGNAGPKSPPLYPAADANVIAVTATDAGDRLFAPSNRGPYIAVAAPGDQVLVVAPDGYEVSSGTSYAAAEVSGIAALMLQREPRLAPDKVRAVLMATARDLGPKGRDNAFGAGLADAYRAVSAAAPSLTSAAPQVEHAATGAR